MAQYAVPISTVEVEGADLDGQPPQPDSLLHLNVDETVAGVPAGNHDGDGSYITGDPPTGQEVVFGLGPLLPPSDLINVKLHVVGTRVDAFLSHRVFGALWQGRPGADGPPSPFLVAVRTYTFSTGYSDAFDSALTTAEAAKITDWADLFVRLRIHSDSGTGEIRITQVYLETSVARVPGDDPVDFIPLQFEMQDVESVDLTQLKVVIPGPLCLGLFMHDVAKEFGPLVLTPDAVLVHVVPQSVTRDEKLTLKPDAVVVHLNPLTAKVNRTLRPDALTIEVGVQVPFLNQPITPDPVIVEVTPQAPTLAFVHAPTVITLGLKVEDPTRVLAPLVLTPNALVVEVIPLAVFTTITPLVLTPDAVVIEVDVQDAVLIRGAKVLTPPALVVEIGVQTVAAPTFGDRVVLPDPVIIEVDIQEGSKRIAILDPDPVIIVVLVPDVDVRIPYRVQILRTPRRPRRRRRPLYPKSTIMPPATFRGRFRHDARGLYRVFGAPEYRFYRRLLVPPEETDTPYATSSTLPATPADAFADGDWYVAASWWNGVIDSGFLPLGANGESYLRLKVASGAVLGEAPHGPGDWRLERRAGGVIAVNAFYYDASALRAVDWSIAFTTNGADPPLDTPTVTVAMPTSGLAVLDHALPAQADGTTVKVRLQTRRQGSFIYSEKSVVKTAVAAAATAGATVETRDRWTGRLPVDSRP